MVWVDAEDVLLWDALDAYFLKMAGKSYRAVVAIMVRLVVDWFYSWVLWVSRGFDY